MTPIEGRLETAEESGLREWFDKQALAAPDNLEAAARQLITLATGLLSVLFVVLAVADDPLPAYLAYPSVRWLGAAVVCLLLLSLAASFGAIFPFRDSANSARPDEQRAAFGRILNRKSRWLGVAAVTFLLGLIALGAVLLIALFTV